MRLERARAIVDAVVAEAREPVSVFVADAHGELVAAATMDGGALRRAHDPRARRQGPRQPGRARELRPLLYVLPRPVAVFEGETRIGAVGVSGLAGKLAEQLALQAIERTTDPR